VVQQTVITVNAQIREPMLSMAQHAPFAFHGAIIFVS